MPEIDAYCEYLYDKLMNFSVFDFLFIVFLVAVLYLTFDFLKRNNAKWLIPVFSVTSVLLICITAFDVQLNSVELRSIFKFIPLIFLFIIILIFHSEIKRDIWRINLKTQGVLYLSNANVSKEEITLIISETVKAVQTMAKSNTGALIVIAKNEVPPHITASGTVLQSKISSQLLESIFNTHTPLHDGAVVIESNKIVAAGCFLPLSQEINLPKELGTRHRAALGITEVADVVVIVVSEETGIISLAENGKLVRFVDGEMLTKKLEQIYGIEVDTKSKKTGRRK